MREIVPFEEGDRHHGGKATTTTTRTTRKRTRGREGCHLRIIREEVVAWHGGVASYSETRSCLHDLATSRGGNSAGFAPDGSPAGERMERGISHGNVKEDGGKKALVKQRGGPSFSLLSRLLNSPPADDADAGGGKKGVWNFDGR